jgi:hypothetical protein
MEPARRLQPLDRRDSSSFQEEEPDFGASEYEVPEWKIKLGKTIFYLTIALSIWFFYWLNGIQCPC